MISDYELGRWDGYLGCIFDLMTVLCEKDAKTLKELEEAHRNGPVAQLIEQAQKEAKEAYHASKSRAAHNG